MMVIKVKATGHGLGYTKYPVEFEFNMNGDKTSWGDEDQFQDELNERVRKQAQRKTACNSVTIQDVEIIEE